MRNYPSRNVGMPINTGLFVVSQGQFKLVIQRCIVDLLSLGNDSNRFFLQSQGCI